MSEKSEYSGIIESPEGADGLVSVSMHDAADPSSKLAMTVHRQSAAVGNLWMLAYGSWRRLTEEVRLELPAEDWEAFNALLGKATSDPDLPNRMRSGEFVTAVLLRELSKRVYRLRDGLPIPPND